MKTKILIIGTLLVANIVKAQTEDNKENYFGLGIYASLENGIGFSARYALSDKFTLQGTFMLPVFSITNEPERYGYNSTKSQTTRFYINYFCIGPSLLYHIEKTRHFREFLYVGSAFYYLETPPFAYRDESRSRSFFNFGGGLGLEFIFGNISLNFQLGQVLVTSPEDTPRSNTSVGGGILFYVN